MSVNDVWKQLYQVVQDRKASPQEGSYTCYLFDKGLDTVSYTHLTLPTIYSV